MRALDTGAAAFLAAVLLCSGCASAARPAAAPPGRLVALGRSARTRRRSSEHVEPVDDVGARDRIAALTFDDGPDPRWTPRILRILESYRVKATFFVLG